jgi:hypothetical protein
MRSKMARLVDDNAEAGLCEHHVVGGSEGVRHIGNRNADVT